MTEEQYAQAVDYFLKARKHLLPFTTYTMESFRVNWHHRVVSDALMDVLLGKNKRLMIFQQPRSGKSELVTRRFPAFGLGKRPDLKFMVAAYGSDLANSFNSDAQRIMASQDYQFLFPDTKMPSTSKDPRRGRYKESSELVELVGNRGAYKSVGVGGAVTGFGFDIGIIDDPIKERKEAESKTKRDAIYDWYTSTFYTRRDTMDAAIILTLTRWHEDDLAGRLLKLAKKDPKADQWRVIRLPAIADEDSIKNEYDPRELGEPLWPKRYSVEDNESLRVNAGPRDWASLYQQSPREEGGNIVKREWFKFYEENELPRFWDNLIQSWDFTFKDTKHADFVVGTVWGLKGSKKYLLDRKRKRMGFTESKEAMLVMSSKWPEAYTKLVEDKANGPAIIDALKEDVHGIVPFNPGKYGSKEARAHACAGQFQAGNVVLPKDAYWIDEYINEWLSFPNGAHDDQVDSTTQALIHLNASGVARLRQMLGG